MGRLYTSTFSAVAVTAAQDFFEINAPADAIVVIHAVYLSQYTDTGDAAEEILSILYKRGATVSGSGGSAFTALPAQFGDVALGGTTEINNTTKANTGTITVNHADAWNVRMPYVFIPTPEMRLVLSPSQRFTVELLAAPADSLTCNGTIYFEEIGG